MKTIPPGIAGVAVATGLLIALSSLAKAQDPDPEPVVSRALSATVDYGNEAIFQPAKQGVDFGILGMRAAQTVTITVQFPAELAGQSIIAEPLDGGILTIPENGLIVGNDGMVVMQFQAPSGSPGACRISVHQPDDCNVLHFWIIDPDHPENTPADLPGAY
ncbi:MAG: hypothetical protein ACRD5Z_04360 [Bryobacteraceae bacterium]